MPKKAKQSESTIMATATSCSCVDQIGETAGAVWRYLDSSGPIKLSVLIKEIDAPRDTLMQALGWLAREEKIVLEDEGRTRLVSLR